MPGPFGRWCLYALLAASCATTSPAQRSEDGTVEGTDAEPADGGVDTLARQRQRMRERMQDDLDEAERRRRRQQFMNRASRRNRGR